jgi:hypothetical protein
MQTGYRRGARNASDRTERQTMSRTMWLSNMPLWESGFLVVGLGTLLGMLGPALLRRYLGIERLKINNEVAGFKFAVVGVVYAVILGFATVVTWEKFRDAEAAVQQEAGAVTALDRLSTGLEQPSADNIQQQLHGYVRAVIDDDWPAMNAGHYSHRVTQALDGLYGAVIAHETHPAEQAILSEMFYQLDQVTQARRARLGSADGIIPGVIWGILIGGAVVTVLFTFFFGSASLLAQVMMNGLLSFLVFVALWVIAEINFPFTGPVHVTPEPLQIFLEDH